MLGSAINNAARALEGLLARWYEDTDGSITSSGSANAYAITSTRTIAALTNNTVMAFTANFTNTGAATLAFNGLAAKNIKRPNGDALVAGDIVSGQPVIVIYKSSPDEWRLLSAPGAVLPASDTAAGGLEIATDAEMETGTDTGRAVVPGRVHQHPAVSKAWARVASNGTLGNNRNVASAVRNSQGLYTITLTTGMEDTGYAIVGCAISSGSVRVFHVSSITSETVFVVNIRDHNDDIQDAAFSFAVFGDH